MNDENKMNNDAKTRKKLITEFEPSTYEDWYKAAEKSLKGKPVEKLISKTYEGIDVKPIYNKTDIEELNHLNNEFAGFGPYVRGTHFTGYKTNPWLISQEINYAYSEEFNQAVRYDLNRGQSAVHIKLGYPGYDKEYQNGTAINTNDDFKKAFDGIDLNKYPLFADAGINAMAFAALLDDHLKKNDINNAKGSILFDPLSVIEANGELPCSYDDAYNMLFELTNMAKESLPGFRTIAINAEIYNDAGSNAIQELAFSFAKAVLYIRQLQEKGLDINDIAKRITFRYSTGPNFFMEIAKLRAARMIWAKILEEFGADEESRKMYIHARTARTNKAKLDTYVNMLRVTNESLAAVIGGCDALHCGNFDESFGSPEEFSRRVARNTQIVLQEECNLTDIIDPAGGSWYVESLTIETARKAWDLFKEVESLGGMEEAVKKGFVVDKINETAAQRVKNLESRKDILLGVNKYPNMEEKAVKTKQCDIEKIAAVINEQTAKGIDKIEITMNSVMEALKSGNSVTALLDAITKNSKAESIAKHLESLHIPEAFEKLRSKSEEYKSKAGNYPKVFLTTMGPVAKHKARADFSADFFRTGGFDPVYEKGYDSNEAAIAALKESGAKIAVICSTDDDYETIVPALAPAIKKEIADCRIILAGYPKDKIDEYKNAGVDEFIHVRANIYNILDSMQKHVIK